MPTTPDMLPPNTGWLELTLGKLRAMQAEACAVLPLHTSRDITRLCTSALAMAHDALQGYAAATVLVRDASDELKLYKTWARAVVAALEPMRPHADRLGVGLGGWLHDGVPRLVEEHVALRAAAEQVLAADEGQEDFDALARALGHA